MKKKLKGRGGRGRGQGRYYDPYDRIRLAERHAELVYDYTKQGVPKPYLRALQQVHAEEHPNGGGSIETTKRLIIRGRAEDVCLIEGEPWFLEKLVPGNRRLMRWIRARWF